MDTTPKATPETKPEPTTASGPCTVVQYPRRLPGDVSSNPVHEAIIKCGGHKKTITGTYDECLAEMRKLTGGS